jgi:glycosyltransferase involved in cell wall biosynthesis
LGCGKPVLISNKVNIWKEIDEAKAGYVAEDTTEGAADLLRRWGTTSLQQRAMISTHATELFQKQYHVEACANAILDLPTLA